MNKACPVILRKIGGQTEILAFRHPLAGKQLVKGTIEANEPLTAACQRELFEESGIHAETVRFLGKWVSGYENQVWGFYLMACADSLPEQWTHFTEDDGGHRFQFFWQPLNRPLDDKWHPLFKGAIEFIKQAMDNISADFAD